MQYFSNNTVARAIRVDAFWDAESGAWCASSEDLRGLGIEDATCARLIARLKVVIPELLQTHHADALAAAKNDVAVVNGVKLNLAKFKVIYSGGQVFELPTDKNAEDIPAG